MTRIEAHPVSVPELQGRENCHGAERRKNRLMKKMWSRTKCDAKRWVKHSPLYFFFENKTTPGLWLWKQEDIWIFIRKHQQQLQQECVSILISESPTHGTYLGTVAWLRGLWKSWQHNGCMNLCIGILCMHTYIHTYMEQVLHTYIHTYIHTWKVYGHTYVYVIHTYVPMYLDETRYPWRYEQGDSRMTRNMSSEN